MQEIFCMLAHILSTNGDALSLTVNLVTRLSQAGHPPLTQVTFIDLGVCLIFESSAKRKSQLSSYHKKRWKDIKLVFLPS
jgi:hypothetical protein